jgi:DNA-binding response OmpR family regulator
VIKVLLIDDDKRHSELLSAYCARFEIIVDCAYDGEQGMRKLSATQPDLILLDVMLPGKDGFQVCQEIRRNNHSQSRIPIIMLTARGELTDRVTGLEIGADDYIAKPFEPRELVARIQTVLRRTNTITSNALIEYDRIRIDTTSRVVIADGNVVDLTSMEYELLLLLASNPGKHYSRDDILSALRGIDAAILTRSVDILVSRLRAKLGDDAKRGKLIHTVWGRGYCFVGTRST